MGFDTVSPSVHLSGNPSRSASAFAAPAGLDHIGARQVPFRPLTYRSRVSRRRPWLAASAALFASLAAAGCGGAASSTESLNDPGLAGGVLSPPNPQPRLTLTDTSGQPYDVLTRNPDKVVLEYFGYTHCPDVCPTTMADIAQALRQSSPDVRRDVRVIFVTVDPHRDSLRAVREWLDGFNPAFVGLRGSLPQVVAAQRAAKLPVSKVSKNGKEVEHASQVIAYTPDHLSHVMYIQGPSTIHDLVHDLPILTTGQSYGA
jgi:protein SCO1/2